MSKASKWATAQPPKLFLDAGGVHAEVLTDVTVSLLIHGKSIVLPAYLFLDLCRWGVETFGEDEP